MPEETDEKDLPNYIKGDLLYFKSETNIDTFEVVEAGCSGSEEVEGMHIIAVYFYKIELVDLADYNFFLSKSIALFSHYGYGNKYGSNWDLDFNSIDTSIVIGRDTIFNLLQSRDLSTNYFYRIMDTDTMVVLKSFLFEKNYGLVQYELNNGETFLLDEKSLKMLMERE